MPVEKFDVWWSGDVPLNHCWLWRWAGNGLAFPPVTPDEPFARVYDYADEMMHLVDMLLYRLTSGRRWRVQELWEHLNRPPVMYFNVALDVVEEDGYADWTLEGVRFQWKKP